MVFVELTRACNLRCPMCRPVLMSGRSLAMSDAVLERVEAELIPYATVVDLRGFGESTLDNRLLPMIDRVATRGVVLKLITNLSIRTPDYWRELGARPVLIGISLEAATPAAYERTRLGAKFDRFLINLAALRSGQRDRGSDDVYFNVVVDDANLDELVGVIELAARHGVRLVALNPIGNEHSIGVPSSSDSRLRSALLDVQRAASSLGVTVQVNANLSQTCSESAGYDQCIHPWSYVYVRYDGGIGFCDHLVDNDASIMGNLMQQDFDAIWNGPEYRAVRQQHAMRQFDALTALGIECAWCYDNRYTDQETLIEPDSPVIRLDGPAAVDVVLRAEPRS